VPHSIAKGRRRRAGWKQRAKTRIDARENRFFGAGRAFARAGLIAAAMATKTRPTGRSNFGKSDYDKFFSIL
jgi:hypothetical protein